MSELSVLTYGADPTGVANSATAFTNFFAAIVAQRAPGRIPEGTYLVNSALTFDLQGLGAGGVRIISDNAIINGTGVAGTVLTIQRSGGTSGSPALTEQFRLEGALTVLGNASAYTVQLGKTDYSDRFSGLTIENLIVSNASSNASAGGVRVGLVNGGSQLRLNGTTAGGSASVGAVEVNKLSNSRLSGGGQASGASAPSLLISEASTNNQVGEFTYGTSATGLSIAHASAANNLIVAPDFTGNANPVNAPHPYAGNALIAPIALDGPLSGGASVVARGSLSRYLAPSAASYTASGADDGLILSSENASGAATSWAAASIPVTLPTPSDVGAGWTMGFVTDGDKAVVLDPPGSVKLLAGELELTTLTLGPGNFQFLELKSDGANFRVSYSSFETARINGFGPPGLPSRWEYPPGPGYQLTQGDNGAVVSSAVVSSALALTLPSTTAVISGWTVTLLRDGHDINLAVNGASGGSVVKSDGTTAPSLAMTYYGPVTLQFDGANFRVITQDAMARDGGNVILPDALYSLGLQLPASADGVIKTSGATTTAGSDIVNLSGVTMTAADVGKRFTALRGGSSVYFAGATIVSPGIDYRGADTITVSGALAAIFSVTAVSAAIVSGGTGGPLNSTFLVKGATSGQRGLRDAARITVSTDGSGVVTSIVRIDKGGVYIDGAFTGVDESFSDTSGAFAPNLTGVTITLTLGVFEVRRKAACFYGRISGTALTVEEVVYGTIAVGDTFSGIEVTEGTTITAGAGLSWTLSNSHSGMSDNVWLFVSETPTTTNNPPAGNISPTGGAGTGLSITPKWKGTPLSSTILQVLSPSQIRLAASATSAASSVGFCYGTDYGAEIQAAIDAGRDVFLPRGVVCHTNQMTYKTGSRLVGQGGSLGNNANTILAYVGAYASRGIQLGADDDVSGEVDGATIGNFLLWGNNLIGIGYRERGVRGSKFLPMTLRAHTYIGAQLSGATGQVTLENDRDALIVREIDSPGWDTTGIYIGPGVAFTDGSGGVYDTCRSLFPYIHADVDAQGYARPIWYRVADSNSHGFVKARGPTDLPGIEFAGHDTMTYNARSIHFSYLDPSSGGVRLRGGVYPASAVASFYNYLNGGVIPDIDGASDDEADDPGIVTEVGARFFGVASNGSLIGARLQPIRFASLQSPKTSTWFPTPISNANTDIPGAPITGTGNKQTIAYTDENEVLRALAPPDTVAVPTVLATGNFTASYTGGANLVRGMAASGTLLYLVSSVTAGDTVLHVIDNSNPVAPVEISETLIVAGVNALGTVALAGGYLFIGINSSTTGLAIVDVSDPKTPFLTATIDTDNGGVAGLAPVGNILFVGTFTGGVFRAYDLSALPNTPPQISTLSLTNVTKIGNVIVQGKYAYVCEENATDTNLGFQIINVSNPASPVLAGSYDASRGAAGDWDVRGLQVRGLYAFLSVYDQTNSYLHVVDIGNPASPTIGLDGATPVILAMSSPAPGAGGSPMILAGDTLYVAGTGGASGLQRYNVTNPLVPTLYENTNLGTAGVSLAILGNILFVGLTPTTDNLKILQIAGQEFDSATIGAAWIDRGRVGHLDVDRDVRVQGSLNVGGQGVYSRGAGAFEGGITAAGGNTVSPRLSHTGESPPASATSGTDTAPVVTETYIAEVFIPANMTITGISVLNGSAVAGSIGVALANSAGAIVASAAGAGIAASGTAARQRVPFSVTYKAKGPATYYVLLQSNDTGYRFRSHPAGADFGASKKTGEVFGTWTPITPPSTFTAALAPIASLY